MPPWPSFSTIAAERLGDRDLLLVADVQPAEEDHAALFQRRRGCCAASRPLSSVSRSVLISLPILGVEIDDVQLCRGESHDVSSLS